MVSDAGVPPCSTTSVASITVQRNLFEPIFAAEYSEVIRETWSLHEPVLTVQALDEDTQVDYILDFLQNFLPYFLSILPQCRI